MPRIALYPGSFDPLTNGHLDLINRTVHIFNQVIVAVASNLQKAPLFSAQERVEMIKEVTQNLPTVTVTTFDGLLVDFARTHKVDAIVRGLRVVSDFEYELQMASINRQLGPEIETVFMVPNAKYAYLSSSIVKEVASLGGEIKAFVPPLVKERLEKKFGIPTVT
ncbi:MAG: pantetheine-phosphate adenylyltransferase [Candidatus Schekmanbacteria bacterium]|nr:pantetheine-phosphate adenylyltransferase [Candidatus Schekmanbacteria bacterium]